MANIDALVRGLQNKYNLSMAGIRSTPNPDRTQFSNAATYLTQIRDLQKGQYGGYTATQKARLADASAAATAGNAVVTQTNNSLNGITADYNSNFANGGFSAKGLSAFIAQYGSVGLSNQTLVNRFTTSLYNNYLTNWNSVRDAGNASVASYNTQIQNNQTAATAAGASAKTALQKQQQAQSQGTSLEAIGNKMQSDANVKANIEAQNLAMQQKDAEAAVSYKAQAGSQQVSGSPSFDLSASKKSSTGAAGAAPSGAPASQPLSKSGPSAVNQPSGSKTVFNAPSMTGIKFGGG
jgi:excinuclease UvrABC nuclease subunit